MTKANIMGSVLGTVREIRTIKRREVEDDIWRRNHLENEREGHLYKVEDKTTVDRSGTERTTLKLWKLIDASELLIETKVTSKITIGVPDYGKAQPESKAKRRDTNSPL